MRSNAVSIERGAEALDRLIAPSSVAGILLLELLDLLSTPL